jgi:hypothetical protein
MGEMMTKSARRPRLGPARRAAHEARTALGDRRAEPDVRWVERLTGASPAEVSRVLLESRQLVALERQIRRLHAQEERRSFAQIRAPIELYALVRLRRPDHVVETGVSSGVSSAHFLAALRRNRKGTLHSIDLPTAQRGRTFGPSDSPVALPPGRATGWVVPSRLRPGWDLSIGPSQQLLPRTVSGLDEIGIFLHDSRHTPSHLAFELATIRPKLVPGSIVLADNTSWTGAAFPRFAAALGAKVQRRRRSDLVGLRVP